MRKSAKTKPAKSAKKGKTHKPAARKAAAANARTPVVEGRPDGLKPGTKLALLLDTAVAAGADGATEEALCKKLGWAACAVTLRRVAERVGAKCVRKDDGKFVVTLKPAKA